MEPRATEHGRFVLSGTDDDDDDDDEEDSVASFDGIPVPWLRSSASCGCWLKSAPAVDAEDAPSVP